MEGNSGGNEAVEAFGKDGVHARGVRVMDLGWQAYAAILLRVRRRETSKSAEI